jgi:hypothetical protein
LGGTWVKKETEVVRALYPRGSDGFDQGGSGVPIRSWEITTFLIGIVVSCETIVEWTILKVGINLKSINN